MMRKAIANRPKLSASQRPSKANIHCCACVTSAFIQRDGGERGAAMPPAPAEGAPGRPRCAQRRGAPERFPARCRPGMREHGDERVRRAAHHQDQHARQITSSASVTTPENATASSRPAVPAGDGRGALFGGGDCDRAARCQRQCNGADCEVGCSRQPKRGVDAGRADEHEPRQETSPDCSRRVERVEQAQLAPYAPDAVDEHRVSSRAGWRPSGTWEEGRRAIPATPGMSSSAGERAPGAPRPPRAAARGRARPECRRARWAPMPSSSRP